MDDEKVAMLIEGLGDDVKTAFIAYLVMDYGSLWLFFGLITWGIRTVWKNRKEFSV